MISLRTVLKTMSLPLVLWLFMCASAPAGTDGAKAENTEQNLLRHSTDDNASRYEVYLVNMDNYTTRGSEYQKKYHPYLLGIAGEMTERHKLSVVPGTIGFYYDKKSNDRGRLYLGLDFNTGITLHGNTGAAPGRVTIAVMDFRGPGDAPSRMTEILRSTLPGVLPVDVMDPAVMKDRLVAMAWNVDRIDTPSAAVEAGRALGVDKVIYGTVTAAGDRMTVRLSLCDVQAEEEDVLEREISPAADAERIVREWVKSFPAERYSHLSEFDNRVPDYGETARYFLNRHLRGIMETLSLCGPVFSESEIVGVVVGFKWVRQGRMEQCNIWISTADLIKFLDNRLAFPELVQRSTVTNTEGDVIRLPL